MEFQVETPKPGKVRILISEKRLGNSQPHLFLVLSDLRNMMNNFMSQNRVSPTAVNDIEGLRELATRCGKFIGITLENCAKYLEIVYPAWRRLIKTQEPGHTTVVDSLFTGPDHYGIDLLNNPVFIAFGKDLRFSPRDCADNPIGDSVGDSDEFGIASGPKLDAEGRHYVIMSDDRVFYSMNQHVSNLLGITIPATVSEQMLKRIPSITNKDYIILPNDKELWVDKKYLPSKGELLADLPVHSRDRVALLERPKYQLTDTSKYPIHVAYRGDNTASAIMRLLRDVQSIKQVTVSQGFNDLLTRAQMTIIDVATREARVYDTLSASPATSGYQADANMLSRVSFVHEDQSKSARWVGISLRSIDPVIQKHNLVGDDIWSIDVQLTPNAGPISGQHVVPSLERISNICRSVITTAQEDVIYQQRRDVLVRWLQRYASEQIHSMTTGEVEAWIATMAKRQISMMATDPMCSGYAAQPGSACDQQDAMNLAYALRYNTPYAVQPPASVSQNDSYRQAVPTPINMAAGVAPYKTLSIVLFAANNELWLHLALYPSTYHETLRVVYAAEKEEYGADAARILYELLNPQPITPLDERLATNPLWSVLPPRGVYL